MISSSMHGTQLACGTDRSRNPPLLVKCRQEVYLRSRAPGRRLRECDVENSRITCSADEEQHMMTPKENLMAILSGQKPEWVPVSVHIANANNLPGHLPRELLNDPLDRLEISRFVGGDILHEINAVRTKPSAGMRTKSETCGDMRAATLVTPEGSLTEEVMYARVPTPVVEPLPEGHVLPWPIVNSVHTSFFIKGIPDYQILKSYHQSLTYEADHDLIVREQNRVGDRGICILGGGPSSPLYSLVARYAGIEQLSLDMFDNPDEVESAMEVMTEAACRWYRAAASSPCDVIRCTEDLDTKLVSPDWFHRYAKPALTEYARICHEKGKKFVVHMCGHVRGLLPDIASIGADAVHCLTSPPTGDTTIREARRVLSGHTAAMLRMDAHLMLNGSAEEIDRVVAEMCNELGNWAGALIIIPCGRASLANIRRVISQFREPGNSRQCNAEQDACRLSHAGVQKA